MCPQGDLQAAVNWRTIESSMSIRLKTFPPLSIFSMGAILGALLVTLMLVPRLITSGEANLNHYGNALATMAAHQAVDASFNHDLVQLQVILRDVMENPNTLLATIHDVENNLLVQAGNHHQAGENGLTYTAPIVLHDSIAGYLTVTLKKYQDATRSVLMFLSLFIAALTAVAAWSLYESRAIEWVPSSLQPQTTRTSKNKEHLNNSNEHTDLLNTELPDTEETSEETDSSLENTPEEMVQAYAFIQVANLQRLTQQLNASTLNNTLAKLEAMLGDVLALYGGRGLEREAHGYCLVFEAPSTDPHEPLFRAACSAHLVIEMAKTIDKIPLQIGACINAEADEYSLSHIPPGELLLNSTAAKNTVIAQRLKHSLMDELAPFHGVEQFLQPYQSLLANQLNQLVKLH